MLTETSLEPLCWPNRRSWWAWAHSQPLAPARGAQLWGQAVQNAGAGLWSPPPGKHFPGAEPQPAARAELGLRKSHGKRPPAWAPACQGVGRTWRRCLQPSLQGRELRTRGRPRRSASTGQEEKGSTFLSPTALRLPPGPPSHSVLLARSPMDTSWAADGSGVRAQLSQENPQSPGLLLRAEWTPAFGGWTVSIHYSRGPPGGLVGLSCLC